MKRLGIMSSNSLLLSDLTVIENIKLPQLIHKNQIEESHMSYLINKLNIENAVLVSDAFFPFSDSIEIANEFGINHFIQTGGSIKDEEIIKTANNLKVSMIFTNQRLFFH